MFNQVLVPLDTSRFAEQALPHAIGVARSAPAKLRLVCVRPALTLDRSGDVEERYLARIASQVALELPQAITHRVLTDELAPYYAPLDSHRVAYALSRHARAQGAELIVMATHGKGGVRRAWLGSVADSLIRTATRPVLLIRPQDEAFGSALGADRGLRHIVIALDGSTTAEQVIPYALRLGSVFDARYSLVRVVAPSEWDAYDVWSARVAAFGVTPPLFVESSPVPLLTRRDVADSLERVAAPMREHGVAVTTHILEDVSPGEAIVQHATRNGADAIALSTGGFGGVHRLLLGSVADRVVRTSEMPVLVCNVRRLEPKEEVEIQTPAEGVAESGVRRAPLPASRLPARFPACS